MEAKELMDAGLTENQAYVYLELLKNPGQTAGRIAKELSIDRSFVYGILNSLIKKGLASTVIKEDRKVFYASNPGNLLKDVEEKKERISALVKRLKIIGSEPKEENAVKTYEGKSGLKVYVRDFLQSKEFFTFGGGGGLSILEELKYQYPQYLKELLKRKLAGKIITSAGNAELLKGMFRGQQIKIRTVENIESHVSFTIFKNKVAVYSAEKKPFAIMIEDKNISDALKAYFDVLWNKI